MSLLGCKIHILYCRKKDKKRKKVVKEEVSLSSSIGSDSEIDEVVSDSTTPPMKKHKTHKKGDGKHKTKPITIDSSDNDKKKVKKHSHALKKKITSKVVEMDTHSSDDESDYERKSKKLKRSKQKIKESVKKPSKEIMKHTHKHKHSRVSSETSSSDSSLYEDETDSDSETSPPKKAKKRFIPKKLKIDMKRRKGIPVMKQPKTKATVAVDMSEWTSIMEFVK